jgi:hypothetical protein
MHDQEDFVRLQRRKVFLIMGRKLSVHLTWMTARVCHWCSSTNQMPIAGSVPSLR